MANTRALRNKIRSIKNTKKITRTMEMIATAKSRVCQKRIEAIQPYGHKLAELMQDLKQARDTMGDDVAAGFPLLRKPAKIGLEAVIIITANRGLCGGYNSNTLKLAERQLDARAAAGLKTVVHMVGKKGASRFKYARRAVEKHYFEFEDKPTFAQAEAVLQPLLDAFAAGELDAVTLVSTRYKNAARQAPEMHALLPLSDAAAGAPPAKKDAAAKAPAHVDFIFEPSPQHILSTLLPLSLKMQFFQALVEAAASEQIARRIAMKNATDNAQDMVQSYTQLYNRTRQAGITQEILEVLGGSESLK